MENRVTRETVRMMAEEIINMVEKNMLDFDAFANDLQDYLEDEGIITIVR